MEHKIIIAGGRDFDNYPLLVGKVDEIITRWRRYNNKIEIVSGKAKGADSLGERYAQQRGFKLKQFPANWEKHGKSAGYKRNKQMAGYADICICFWDGESKGTAHMIDLTEEYGLTLHIIKY